MPTTPTTDIHDGFPSEEPIVTEVGPDSAPPALLERTTRDRMTIHTQTPELDGIFIPELDFPGSVIKSGTLHERSFAFGRECRICGLKLPKGLVVERIVAKVGPRFRPVPVDGSPVARYEGDDCLVFEGEEAVRGGGWKEVRLVPELGGALFVLVRNATGDDLRFEGTLLLQEDRVPEPEHETL